MSDIIGEVTVDSEPVDRLTALCKIMTDALDEALDKEREADLSVEPLEVRGIVFLNDPEKGGIQMFGYDDPAAGMADLLVHLKAIFSSMGKEFGVMTDQGIMLMDLGEK